MKNILFCFGALSLLSAQILANEPILSVDINKRGVKLQVHSGGCTKQEHFVTEVSNNNEITLTRVMPDRCKANMSFWLNFSFDQLNIKEGQLFSINGDGFRVEARRNTEPHGFFCKMEEMTVEYKEAYSNEEEALIVTNNTGNQIFSGEKLAKSQNGNKEIFKWGTTGPHRIHNVKLTIPTKSSRGSTFMSELEEKTFFLDVGGTLENDPNMKPPKITTLSCFSY